MNPTTFGPQPALPTQPWSIIEGDSPLIAVALHNGHSVRADLAERLAIDQADRLREEDPYTGGMADVAATQIVVYRSRFEVDLNRAREKCLYRRPEDSWGLQVWRQPPTEAQLAESLAFYDRFYEEMERLLERFVSRFGRVVVLDLHSYNHRRGGREAPPDDPKANPEVNIGTGTMDLIRWQPLIDRFVERLRSADFLGRPLDVRENVKFQGGHFPRWVHQRFPESVCAPAIELKKIFMDEWTGQADAQRLQGITDALRQAANSLLRELARP